MEYTFTITVEVNCEATEEEVRNFIGFECGAMCSIDNDNPFIDGDSNAEISRIDID